MPTDRTSPLGTLLAGPRLPALDGLRMVAVMLVILSHAGLRLPSDLGVSVFFVLSGFLITWLLMKEWDRAGRIDLAAFYVRRAFRLLPAYYAYLAVALALYLPHPWARRDIIAPALFYYANYFNATEGHPETPISHTWSLAVEEQFYVLWPFLFGLLARVSRRTIAAFLVTAIVFVAAWRSFLFLHWGMGTSWVYNAFDCRFDNLAVGCLLAVLSPEPRFLAAARAVARHPALPLVPIGLLALLHRRYVAVYQCSVGFTVDALLIGLAMLQILQLSAQPSWRWLDHPVARYVGTISYPMYLWHGFAVSPMRRISHLPLVVQMVVYTGVTIALGALSYHLLEKRFLALRGRLFDRRRAPATT